MSKQVKLPWMKFFPDNWLGDTELQSNDWDTIGFWANLISYLWKSKTRGKITGTYKQIANTMGCTQNEVKKFLRNLSNSKTAEITQSNGIITVRSRRIWREERKRRLSAERSRRYRARKHHVHDMDYHKDIPDTRGHIPDNKAETVPAEAVKLTEMFLQMRIIDKRLTDKETDRWQREIWKLYKIDGESWNEIERVIKWALSDPFWYKQVQSPLKFRRNDPEGVRYWDKFKALSMTGRKSRDQIQSNTDYNKNEL